MPITRLSGQGASGSSTTIAVSAPAAGTPTGTLRLMTLFWYNSGTITAPSGWTSVLAPISLQSGLLACYRRWHTDGEGTYNFTKTATGAFAARITNLAGVDPTDPIDVAAVTTSQGAGSNVYSNVPQITPLTSGAWVFWSLVAGLVQTTSRNFVLGSGGWTGETPVVYSATQGVSMLNAYQEYNTPAATGTRNATFDLSTPFRGLAVSLRPAASAALSTSDHFHGLAAG